MTDDAPDVDPIDDLVRGLASPAPPPGFAARVVAAHARRRRVRRVAAGALVATCALAAALLLVVVRGPASGEVAAVARESVTLGSHVVAVLEPGARAHWSAAGAPWSERVDVEQPAGDAFYRVDKGTPVTVHTPAGDVVVHGTCFTVSLRAPGEESMPPVASRPPSRFVPALAGAALGSLLTVAVLEGSVVVTNGHGEVAAHPGEAVVARADRAPALSAGPKLDEALYRKLRAENEDLKAALDNAQHAAGGDVGTLVAENRDLRDKLRHDDAELARVAQERKDKEGEALPFPDDLPPRFSEQALLRSFAAAFKEAGIPGDVTHIDCDEYPCIVYGDVTPAPGTKHLDAGKLMKQLAATPSYAQYKDDADNNSWWRSLKKDESGNDVDETHFGIALWPKGSGEQSDAIGKRIGFRNQQMWDAMKPARP